MIAQSSARVRVLKQTGCAMIDWERVDGLRAEIGDADFGEVVDLFLEEVDETVARMTRGGAEAADLHFLKGCALNLGFADLAQKCLMAERHAAAGDPVDAVEIGNAYRAARGVFLAKLGLSGGRAA